jgi:hypothetical protein
MVSWFFFFHLDLGIRNALCEIELFKCRKEDFFYFILLQSVFFFSKLSRVTFFRGKTYLNIKWEL